MPRVLAARHAPTAKQALNRPVRAGQTMAVNDAITVTGGAADLTQFSASSG